jgi:hypothetical protein
MKIEDVEAIPYQIPFRKPLKFASGQITHTEHVLIRIRTSDGFIGIADAPPRPYVLLTTLFTDIVGSTELLTTHGDAHWCRRLAMHDNIVETRNWSSTGDLVPSTRETAYSRYSTAPLTPRGADWIWSALWPRADCGSARLSTPASASVVVTSGAEWRSTSAPALWNSPTPAKS